MPRVTPHRKLEGESAYPQGVVRKLGTCILGATLRLTS